LFEGVLPGYVATLPYLQSPALQITSDLMKMNGVERLVDGSVPLQIWLHNAARMAFEAGHRATFQQVLDSVASQASGEPDLGPVADPVELQEEIVFQDDTVPFDYLAHGAAAGASVGRLTVPPYQGGARRTTPLGAPANPHGGTGWLITPTLLVTNHHVLNARSAVEGPAPQAGADDLALQAAGTVVRFDYDAESADGVEVGCSEAVAWSPELDYAVLRLAESPGRAGLPVRSSALDAKLEDNVPVNVIQHPDGKAKRIGLRNNIVHGTTEQDIRYFTDTQRGSSGSPVLTDDWVVCALHRGSRRVDVKFQGKSSAYVNVGTQISAVLADLAQRNPTAHDEVRALQ
ncbi:MAG: trypsin-like peptidase domain-containing protein, partial [Jiangellaceae bacterium]